MDIPIFGPLFAVFGRVLTAMRQNPCTIEKLDDPTDAPRLRFRVRNDSSQPTRMERLHLNWKLKGDREFTHSEVPMDILLSPITPKTYAPAEDFTVGVMPSQIEGDPVEVQLEVYHNRAPKPAVRVAKLKRDPKTRNWVWA
jgi:hypothetical protein